MDVQSSRGREKAFVRGTHRVRHPRETIDLLRPRFGSTGITRVANVTGLDTIGIPVAVAVRPNSRSLSVSQGKGVDLDSAIASAVLESVEQFHAERPDIPLVWATQEELERRVRVVDCLRLPAFARPFSAHRPILWATGLDIASGVATKVPFDMVHLDLRYPPQHCSGCFPLGSNGLASGNDLLEATAHGLWELVERDAVAVFFGMPEELQRDRRLDLGTVDDPVAVSLLESIVRANMQVAVWEATSDVGLPTFCAIIVESEGEVFRRVGPARGYGCHNDRGIALCRALTEAAQSRLTRIMGARDDVDSAAFDAVRSEGRITEAQQMVSAAAGAPRSYCQVPTWAFPTFEEDLAWILQRLSAAGMDDVLRVVLSPADWPVCVVRVIVPGLEGAPEVPGYRPGSRARALAGGRSP